MTAETHLLYKIAKAYYEDGLTQSQIGKRLGLSRIKISRLLHQARQNGVVQITIAVPVDSHADLERELEAAYGLDEVVVAATSRTNQSDVVPAVGQAAAAYLARCIEDGIVLDLSWGTTLLATVDAMTPQNLPHVRVVQMLGGLGKLEAEAAGGDLALRLATIFGARMRLLWSPSVVSSKLVRDALLQDANIAETLVLAARADVALVGIGSPTPNSVVIQSGMLTINELDELRTLGAVGDIALRFFDADGKAVEHPINERIIGLELAQIQRIPRVIGVAGGIEKFQVVRAALRGRLINVLVTDEHLAQALLADLKNPVGQQEDRQPVAGKSVA